MDSISALEKAANAVEAAHLPPTWMMVTALILTLAIAVALGVLTRKSPEHLPIGYAAALGPLGVMVLLQMLVFEDIREAEDRKQAACQSSIEQVADSGDTDVLKAALEHDCSSDKLLIAATASGNGLSASAAKALIAERDGPDVDPDNS